MKKIKCPACGSEHVSEEHLAQFQKASYGRNGELLGYATMFCPHTRYTCHCKYTWCEREIGIQQAAGRILFETAAKERMMRNDNAWRLL